MDFAEYYHLHQTMKRYRHDVKKLAKRRVRKFLDRREVGLGIRRIADEYGLAFEDVRRDYNRTLGRTEPPWADCDESF